MEGLQRSDRSTSEIDLEIKNLQQEKKILLLEKRIQELEAEGRGTTRAGSPRNRLLEEDGSAFPHQGTSSASPGSPASPCVHVTSVSSSGQVELRACDGAAVLGEATGGPGSRPPRETQIVRVEARKHAMSFNFERRDEWVRKYTSDVANLPDEMRRRQCLIKAIKQNCGEITKGVPMQDGMFLDQLSSVRCIDDEERKLVSESRKDEANQMRAIIAFVLKKDFNTNLVLVSCFRENNRDLSETIIRSYETLVLSERGNEETCWLCQIRARVKYPIFLDELLSEDVIDGDLYYEASREDASPGQRRETWAELLKQLTRGDARTGMQAMRRAVHNSGVHSDIAKLIGREIDDNTAFQCKCGPQMQVLKESAFGEERDPDSGHNTFLDTNTQDHDGEVRIEPDNRDSPDSGTN